MFLYPIYTDLSYLISTELIECSIAPCRLRLGFAQALGGLECS